MARHRVKYVLFALALSFLASRGAVAAPHKPLKPAKAAPAPARPHDIRPYYLGPADEEVIAYVFGPAFLDEIRHRFFLTDLGDPVFQAAFIPSADEIWLNCRVPVSPFALVHEATHYYQLHYLGRKMKTDRIYALPQDLSHLMDIEQEAMLTMAYAWEGLPELRSFGPPPPAPPPEEVRRYLAAFMAIKTEPPRGPGFPGHHEGPLVADLVGRDGYQSSSASKSTLQVIPPTVILTTPK